MTIAITGASGQLGRLTAEALLETVAPSDVVLVTRSPDALADLAERGATVRRADFDDPASLPPAFEGHPLRKEFVLASRVAKAWAGA